jgi:hypothetical protein
MELPVERRASGREGAQRRQLPVLVFAQLLSAPPLAAAEDAARPQDARDDRRVHVNLPLWPSARRAHPVWAPGLAARSMTASLSSHSFTPYPNGVKGDVPGSADPLVPYAFRLTFLECLLEPPKLPGGVVGPWRIDSDRTRSASVMQRGTGM